VTLEIFKYPVVTQSAWTVFPPSLETGLKHYSHWNNIQCTLVDIYTIKQCEKYVAKLTSLEKWFCIVYVVPILRSKKLLCLAMNTATLGTKLCDTAQRNL